jgi:hypothetical protein
MNYFLLGGIIFHVFVYQIRWFKRLWMKLRDAQVLFGPIDPKKKKTIPSVQFLLESLCVPWATQLPKSESNLVEHIFPSPLLGAFKKKRNGHCCRSKCPTYLSDFLSRKQTKNYTQHRSLYLVKPLGLHCTKPNLKIGLLFMSMINMTKIESACFACWLYMPTIQLQHFSHARTCFFLNHSFILNEVREMYYYSGCHAYKYQLSRCYLLSL